MKINEVRELTTPELKEKLYSLQEQLFELRRKKAVGALEKPEDVIGVRKDIARINLVIRMTKQSSSLLKRTKDMPNMARE